MSADTSTIRRPRIGLVIGSGGLKCAAAVGLWRVLQREGITVDMAVGCSGGSLYSAAIALGWSSVDEFQSDWQDLFRKRRGRSFLELIFPRWFGFNERFGVIDDTRINEVVERVFGRYRFEETAIPLHIGATDLLTGEKVVLSSGRIADAIRASIAIPFVLPPWEIDGRLLTDGGASDPLPIDVAIREGCEIIIAMGFENPLRDHLASPMQLVHQTSALTVNHLLKATYAFYSLVHHAEVIPVIPQFDRMVGMTDTHLLPWLVEMGEKAAEREMPYLRRLLAEKEFPA